MESLNSRSMKGSSKYLATVFAAVILVGIVIGMAIVFVISRKMNDISINMPKVNLPPQELVIRVDNSPGNSGENFSISGPNVRIVKKSSHEEDVMLSKSSRGKESSESSKEKFETTNVKSEYCANDSDCNNVHGDGTNICKKDGTCHCILGDGVLCHLGKMNYKHPSKMTKEEQGLFKQAYRSNFTLQDYQNWLLMYKNDSHNLRSHHRVNLYKIMVGKKLTDLPVLRVKQPVTTDEYFKKMYKNGKISVQFKSGNETGGLLEYNTRDYSNHLTPPADLDKALIIDDLDLTKIDKDNVNELNYYIRPMSMTGNEERFIGEKWQEDELEKQEKLHLRERPVQIKNKSLVTRLRD